MDIRLLSKTQDLKLLSLDSLPLTISSLMDGWVGG